MLTPTIDVTNVSLLFSSALTGYAVFWSIKKALTLLTNNKG